MVDTGMHVQYPYSALQNIMVPLYSGTKIVLKKCNIVIYYGLFIVTSYLWLFQSDFNKKKITETIRNKLMNMKLWKGLSVTPLENVLVHHKTKETVDLSMKIAFEPIKKKFKINYILNLLSVHRKVGQFKHCCIISIIICPQQSHKPISLTYSFWYTKIKQLKKFIHKWESMF